MALSRFLCGHLGLSSAGELGREGKAFPCVTSPNWAQLWYLCLSLVEAAPGCHFPGTSCCLCTASTCYQTKETLSVVIVPQSKQPGAGGGSWGILEGLTVWADLRKIWLVLLVIKYMQIKITMRCCFDTLWHTFDILEDGNIFFFPWKGGCWKTGTHTLLARIKVSTIFL